MIGRKWAPTSDTGAGAGQASRHRLRYPKSAASSKREKLDHPICQDGNVALRQRVIQLLRNGCSVRRGGNIIFVCGGNAPTDLRLLFREYCAEHHPEFEVFFPEFAMKTYFSSPDVDPFDIAEFETLIAELSHVIVVFPEAAGSYAETGYFSAVKALASKTILAMDLKYQSKDSFISLGPAKKINKSSQFQGTIQMSYESPTFSDIISRIQVFPLRKNKKTLQITKFSAISNYEKFCLIHRCVDILRIATLDDIYFMFRALFHGHISKPNIKKLTSVLVGAEYLQAIGDYGHVTTNENKAALLSINTGFQEKLRELSIEIGVMISRSSSEFRSIVETF